MILCLRPRRCCQSAVASALPLHRVCIQLDSAVVHCPLFIFPVRLRVCIPSFPVLPSALVRLCMRESSQRSLSKPRLLVSTLLCHLAFPSSAFSPPFCSVSFLAFVLSPTSRVSTSRKSTRPLVQLRLLVPTLLSYSVSPSDAFSPPFCSVSFLAFVLCPTSRVSTSASQCAL